MNSDQISTSTTDTLSRWKPAGSEAALTAGTITLAVSAHAFMHVSLLTGTVLAVVLLRPQAGLCALYGVLIAVAAPISIPLKSQAPSDYFTRALANLVNALNFRALVPEGGTGQPAPEPAPAAQAAPAAEPALSPLPPATNAARTVEETIYWQVTHDQMPARVPPQPRGRHARTASASTADDPAGSTTADDLLGNLAADDLTGSPLVLAET